MNFLMTSQTRAAKKPKKTFYPVSNGWKQEVQRAMAAQGVSRMQLARAVNVTHGAITVLLDKDTRSSHLVPLIERFLGLQQSSGRSDLHERWDLVWHRLPEEKRSKLLRLAEETAALEERLSAALASNSDEGKPKE